MSHIPGPWRQGGTKELSPTGRCREIVADEGRIGLVYGTTDEDCKANARLIAAAPDLLKALKQVARLKWGYDGDCGALAIVENAIALAAAPMAERKPDESE